ncbi:MAG: VanZ family protein [Acutalibacteraceae bacterium]|nr:VanZ family protein [Acutalibacteraceae bacterium]
MIRDRVEHPKSTIFFRVLFALTTVSIMAIIFVLSSQDAVKSSEVSGNFIEKIFDLFPFLQYGKEMDFLVSSLQIFVRSFAHFAVFGALGVSVCAFASTFNVSGLVKFVLCQLFCSLYAVSDELHQKFSLGRSCQIKDMVVDSLGSAFGIVFVLILAAVISKLTFRRSSMRKKELIKQVELLTQKLFEADRLIAQLQNEIVDRNNDIALLNEKLVKSVERAEKTESQEVEVDSGESDTKESDEIVEVIQTAEQETVKEIEVPVDEKPEDKSCDEEKTIKEYCIKAISKIISESVKVSCALATANSEKQKELLNLSLGRTEVAKEEISCLSETELPFEELKECVDKQVADTLEYYKNILSQI